MEDKIIFKKSKGYRQLYPEKLPIDNNTLFDMASLTKVMCTTIVTMKLIELGELHLSDTLDYFFDSPLDKSNITIKQLMTHTSGLPASINFYTPKISYDDVLKEILSSGLCEIPGTKVVYSDNGFILLGIICEKVTGKTLEVLSQEMIYKPLRMSNTSFFPNGDNFAATEYDPIEDKYIYGVVHDENARNFGCPCGHAGLFSAIDDVAKFASMLLNKGYPILTSATFNLMIKNHTEGLNIARSLGFCYQDNNVFFGGDLPAVGSFGHTGFTGTSLCIDPVNKISAVLLTNRVHPTRNNLKILRFRHLFHNVVWSDLL
jgi:CubicO group peptidase (beta-lactamase class C family)